MIPGVNPKQLQQMMKQMGMSQEEMGVTEITMKTESGKVLKFSNPSVQKVSMQGQTTFQITGEYSEEEETVTPQISGDDITTVAQQANVSQDKAQKALEKTNGDIAQAIVELSN